MKKKKKRYPLRPSILFVLYLFVFFVFLRIKVLPGKEGHPSCRVSFCERLYEKKVDSFVQAKSARSNCDCAAITSSHIVFLTFLFSPKETRASAAELLADPYLN